MLDAHPHRSEVAVFSFRGYGAWRLRNLTAIATSSDV